MYNNYQNVLYFLIILMVTQMEKMFYNLSVLVTENEINVWICISIFFQERENRIPSKT